MQIISVLPLDGDAWGDLISKIGDNQPLWQRPGGHFRWITPGLLETLRIPLVAGRFLNEEDRGKNVAIVSQQVAQTVWPGKSAIGQLFRRGDPDEQPFKVIGGVGDLRSVDLSQPMPRMVYVPTWYRSSEHGSFVIRTTEDPISIASAVRKTIWMSIRR